MARTRTFVNRSVARGLSRRAAERGATFAGLEAENILDEFLQPTPPRRGRLYQRGGVSHRASAPGQSPVNDSGQLRQSIASVVEERRGRFVATVGSPLAYGLALELGTGNLRGPRPWVSRLGTRASVARMRRALVAGLIAGGVRDDV